MTNNAVKKRKILIADDDLDLIRLLRILLEEFYEMHVANDGIAALKLANKIRPPVIISDLGMPGMNGLEFTKAIRENPLFAKTRIIIMTGATEGEELPSGFWLKGTVADAFLEKPFPPEELLREINRQFVLRAQGDPLPPGKGHY